MQHRWEGIKDIRGKLVLLTILPILEIPLLLSRFDSSNEVKGSPDLSDGKGYSSLWGDTNLFDPDKLSKGLTKLG